MTLYRVSVETEVYVLAESEQDAEDVAWRAVQHDCDSPDLSHAAEVKTTKGIPTEWLKCLPFLGFGYENGPDKTVGELAEEVQAKIDAEYARNRPEQGRLFTETASADPVRTIREQNPESYQECKRQCKK